MCGISLIVRSGLENEKVRADLARINQLQIHRGPNFQDLWSEELPHLNLTIGIGHQRLSILDLSSGANQPMVSPRKKSVLAFNGEIYNFQSLAGLVDDELSALPSRGDTATLLAMLDMFGANAHEHLNGMWAFIYYNRQNNDLILSRDRFGMKPLYYYCDQEQLIVTSEIKPILDISRTKFKVNTDSVGRYLFQSLLNTNEETFFDSINSIPASSFVRIPLNSFAPKSGLTLPAVPYWRHPMRGGEAQVISDPIGMLREAIRKSVGRHLLSDVPSALFLSGGLDSSSLLTAAIEATGKAPHCFSVISSSEQISEEAHIRLMASTCGIEPTYLNVDQNPEYYLESLPELCRYNEQPVTTFTVAAHSDLVRLAKQSGYTVLLTGQGIDEQLGGYNKFFYIHLMDSLRKGKLAEFFLQSGGALFNSEIYREFRIAEAKRYIPFLRDWVKASYLGEELENARFFSMTAAKGLREREAVDLFETSLPAILHYEDRMSMRHSCEMRVPFLDLEIVNILANLPEKWHIRGGVTKYALRSAMSPLLPKRIAFRKDKKGFSLPEERWIRELFAPRIVEKFSGDAHIYQHGFARKDGVLKLLDRFRAAAAGVGSKDIFNLYCLEVWLEQFSSSLR